MSKLRTPSSSRTHVKSALCRLRRRRPILELLEGRALLAISITVNTTADTIDPTFNQISLREAIEISNGTLIYNPATDMNVPQLVTGTESVPGPGSPPAPNDIRFDLPGSGIQTIEVWVRHCRPSPSRSPSTATVSRAPT